MNKKAIGSALMVTGTTVGAGMLTVPHTIASLGLSRTFFMFCLIWFIMDQAAQMMLRVHLACPPKSNLISMAQQTLGRVGSISTIVLYCLLLYALLTAYLSGLHDELAALLHMPSWVVFSGLSASFGLLIFSGTRASDLINRAFMFGLSVFFIGFLVQLIPYANQAPLSGTWKAAWFPPSLSLIIVAFGYQIIIPTLSTYLDRDPKAIVIAIRSGSALTLIINLIWVAMIFSIIPMEHLSTSGATPDELTTLITHFSNGSSFLHIISHGFMLCAITTSFIGVGLCLFDFLSDGVGRFSSNLSNVYPALLAFVPPLIFVMNNPQMFARALNKAGIIVTLLLIALPCCMDARMNRIRTSHVLLIGLALWVTLSEFLAP